MVRMHLFWVAPLVWLLAGCQLVFGGVDVKAVNSSVQRPSNVAIYVAVSDADEPLTELDESNFKIFENDQAIDAAQSQLTLLQRDEAAVHHSLLLVDLSGSLEASSKKTLEQALAGFIQSLTKSQSVSVYGFDGNPEIWALGSFERDHNDPVVFSKLKGGDPSRNLNGAVMQALDRLDAELMRVKRPIRVGTLVVFTRGPDVAGRQPLEAMTQAIDESQHDIFAIGLQSEEAGYLEDIGRSGKEAAPSFSALGPTFAEAASRLTRAYERYYLVQYCSPARAGTPTFRLEVHYTTKEGEERSGDLELAFDASGFGPGCDPKTKPTFRVPAQHPWDMNTKPTDTAVANPPNSSDSVEADEHPEKSAPIRKSAPAEKQDPGEPVDEEDDDAIVPPPNQPGYE